MRLSVFCIFTFLFTSQVFGADFSLEFVEARTNYRVRFSKGFAELSGTQFTLDIPDRPCSRERVEKFRQSLESSLGNYYSRSSGEGKSVTLTVQGVTSKIPANDKMAARLRRLPFDLFTLRQSADRECKKSRGIASVEEMPLLDPAAAVKGAPASRSCPNCVPTETSQVRAQREDCIKAICPSAEFANKKLTGEALKIDALQQEAFRKELLPIINRILAHEKTIAKKQSDLIAKIDPSQKVTDKTGQALLHVVMSFSQVPLEAFDADKDGDMTLNMRKLKQLRPDLKPNQLTAAAQAIGIMNKIEKAKPVKGGPLDRLTEVYSRARVMEFIGDALVKLKAEWANLSETQKSVLGLRAAEIESNLKELGALKSIDEYPGNILEILDYDFRTVLMVKFLPRAVPAEAGQIALAKAAKETRESYVKNIASKTGEMEKNELDPRAACAASYSLLKAYSPSSQQKARLELDRQSIIAKFMQSAGKLLSKSSSEKIHAKARDWDFALPPTGEEALRQLKRSLELTERRVASLAKHNASHASVGDVIRHATNPAEDQSKLYNACVKVEETIRDAAFQTARTIYISPVVAKAWPKSAGVVFHELGHLLDYELNEKGISGETKGVKKGIDGCLASQHPKTEGTSQTKFSVEDWADFMEALEEASPLSMECLFMRDWLEPSKMKEADFSLANNDTTDTHSGLLFRRLAQINTRNGAIPASCRSALEAKGEKPLFKDCRPAKAKASAK